VTKVDYAPSTRFYLEDQKRPETRWKTTLPFPVHVVSRVEVIDYFSKSKLTTQYQYHHGYWDGAEREFRGFGMVEQRDTELFEEYDSTGLHGDDAVFTTVDRKNFSPPTLSKTWFHQGPVGDEFGEWEELDRSDEYWSGDPQILKHTETVNQYLSSWPPTPEGRRVKRDALRTLRGSILRTELYALDGSDREDRPYTVSETSYGLLEIAPPTAGDSQRLHIFFPHSTSHAVRYSGDDPIRPNSRSSPRTRMMRIDLIRLTTACETQIAALGAPLMTNPANPFSQHEHERITQDPSTSTFTSTTASRDDQLRNLEHDWQAHSEIQGFQHDLKDRTDA
jgi:hypothetical protein